MKWYFKNFGELCILLCAILYSYLSVCGGVAAQNHDDDHGDCSKDELIRCLNPLGMITDENKEIRFVTNKEELDQMCPHLNYGLICVRKYTRRCMEQEQQDQFNRLYEGTRKVIEDVCEEGQYQQEYLRHAPCVQKVRSDDENCAAKYQRELRDINQETRTNVSSQSESNKNVKKVCCSLQTYLECSERAVLTMCGPETAAFTKGFLDTMASSLIQTHCEKYPAGSEECSTSGSLRHGVGAMQLSLGLVATVILFVLQQIRT